MKISVNQYAKVLYELTENKKQPGVDGILTNFLKVLRKNDQMKLARKILEKFSQIYDKNNSIIEAEVTSATELSEKSLKEVQTFIAQKYSAKKVNLIQIVKKEIKGGIILKVGDEMLDASVVKKIGDLKAILIR